MPNLPIEPWKKDKILKIAAAAAGSLYFLTSGWKSSSKWAFAHVCVLIDTFQLICPRTKVMVNEDRNLYI